MSRIFCDNLQYEAKGGGVIFRSLSGRFGELVSLLIVLDQRTVQYGAGKDEAPCPSRVLLALLAASSNE